ncbi:hypothetical protein E2562_025360 [Oryza meyeriana var. granulata]|uniref:DUF834 domain-containing protein n=1 Tax=Oryza meyeriana var. granulata TaxID=110450 RepID=A0A6G1DM86_9ORYZ|nr:hypothetical protein E2562_025360 [Oryza meyeriana var. granulata]
MGKRASTSLAWAWVLAGGELARWAIVRAGGEWQPGAWLGRQWPVGRDKGGKAGVGAARLVRRPAEQRSE